MAICTPALHACENSAPRACLQRRLTWNVPETIVALSKLFTLAPGDLIMTGTPAGVGAIHTGQQVCAGVDCLPEVSLTVNIL